MSYNQKILEENKYVKFTEKFTDNFKNKLNCLDLEIINKFMFIEDLYQNINHEHKLRALNFFMYRMSEVDSKPEISNDNFIESLVKNLLWTQKFWPHYITYVLKKKTISEYRSTYFETALGRTKKIHELDSSDTIEITECSELFISILIMDFIFQLTFKLLSKFDFNTQMRIIYSTRYFFSQNTQNIPEITKDFEMVSSDIVRDELRNCNYNVIKYNVVKKNNDNPEFIEIFYNLGTRELTFKQPNLLGDIYYLPLAVSCDVKLFNINE